MHAGRDESDATKLRAISTGDLLRGSCYGTVGAGSHTRFAGSYASNKTAKIRFALSFFVPQGPAKAPGAGVRDLTGPVPRGTVSRARGEGLSCREWSPAPGCRKASK